MCNCGQNKSYSLINILKIRNLKKQVVELTARVEALEAERDEE